VQGYELARFFGESVGERGREKEKKEEMTTTATIKKKKRKLSLTTFSPFFFPLFRVPPFYIQNKKDLARCRQTDRQTDRYT
jgi:hypothetical protein